MELSSWMIVGATLAGVLPLLFMTVGYIYLQHREIRRGDVQPVRHRSRPAVPTE